jgi:hypothetical protein
LLTADNRRLALEGVLLRALEKGGRTVEIFRLDKRTMRGEHAARLIGHSGPAMKDLTSRRKSAKAGSSPSKM